MVQLAYWCVSFFWFRSLMKHNFLIFFILIHPCVILWTIFKYFLISCKFTNLTKFFSHSCFPSHEMQSKFYWSIWSRQNVISIIIIPCFIGFKVSAFKKSAWQEHGVFFIFDSNFKWWSCFSINTDVVSTF